MKIIEIPIGGALNEFARQLVQKSKIEQCRSVLCALAELMFVDNSTDVVFPEKENTQESAAYQLIFNALYHRYLIPFYAPRIPRFQESAYQINLKRFEVFNSDQVDLISEALWKLPTTFDQLPTLLYFLADNKKRELGDVANQDSIMTLSDSVQARMLTLFQSRPDRNYECYGFIVMDNQKWGKYLNDSGINLPRGRRVLTQDELRFIEPDIRDRLKRKNMDTPLHELAHAFDFSYAGDLSSQKEWLNLSFWKKNSSPVSRKLLSYNKISPDILDNTVSILNEWSHSVEAKFINSYAQTDPIEDFAVHMAGYIQFPNETTAIHQGKAKFLSQKVFSGIHKGSSFRFQFQKKILSRDVFPSYSDLIQARRIK